MPSESHYRQLMQAFSSPFLPKKAAKAAKPRSCLRFERIWNPVEKSFIAVWGKSWAPHFLLYIHWLPWRKAAHGGLPEVSKRRKNTDGGVTPGGIATIKEAPRGRQRPEQLVIELVGYSVAPSGRVFKITFLCETKKRLYFSIYVINF